MSTGKYSPTVYSAYMHDQKWWEKNGGESNRGDHGFFYDIDGYDQYGYNKAGVDRAGYTEEDYLTSISYVGVYIAYTLYDNVFFEWGIDKNGKPAKIK